MANKIKGNNDGLNGRNETYTIPGRGSSIPRRKLINERKQGKHPNHTIIKINNDEYVKSKPNSNTNDNVNLK